ncbi:hypothetical protein [Kitasatospora cineracea]|uniref:hypothetical protein n=1 Tax=Kitasatospora cineracea TaxID=88074 RepID=UPI001ABF8A8A|nr:hypothetical protein [Kitasatospora cineracea]
MSEQQQPPHPTVPLRPVGPPPPTAPPRPRHRAGRWGAVAAALVLVGAGAAALADRDGTTDTGAGPHVLPGSPRALLLDGVSGRVEITAAQGTAATAEYLPEGTGHPGPVALGPAGSDGVVPVRCAAADGGPFDRCGGLLRLAVPEDTALTVRQESGEITLSGLRGDLALSLASVRCTAVGLRPQHATVSIRSGSADLGFAAPPGDLTVESASASVALRLPQPDGGYAFDSDASSADVRIGLPEQPGAAHRVRLRTTSASVAVLPAAVEQRAEP